MYRFQVLFFLFMPLLWINMGCGTGIGSAGPAATVNVNSPSGTDIYSPYNQYAQSTAFDCGFITNDNAQERLLETQTCMHEAFATCTPVRMFRSIIQDDNRFESFVEIRPLNNTCSVYVSVFSDLDTLNIGADARTCETLNPSQSPETACGIAE